MPRAKKFTDRDIKEKAKPGKLLHVSDTPCLYLWTSPGPKGKQRFILRFSRPDGSGVTTKISGHIRMLRLKWPRTVQSRLTEH